ncbi:hypothetical protein B0G81_1750 [Paraburkholderia sp. BL6665CI2N2]|nr:hypothetical protein B0G81_1750 [Paraburkholderia sp. BL6665CI2N2]
MPDYLWAESRPMSDTGVPERCTAFALVKLQAQVADAATSIAVRFMPGLNILPLLEE